MRARREREARARDQVDDLAAVSDDGVPQRARWEDERTQPVIFDNSGRAEAIELTPGEQFLNDRIDRLKGETRRAKTDSAEKLLKALGERPPNERLAALETLFDALHKRVEAWFGGAKKLLGILVGSFTAVIAAAVWIGALKTSASDLQDEVKALRAEVRILQAAALMRPLLPLPERTPSP